MTELYPHQEEILKQDHPVMLIPYGTGSGKTRIALLLARGRTLVICPKTQFLDQNWQRERDKLGLDIDLHIISKDAFRKVWNMLPPANTVIIEEAHTCSGVTPNIRYIKGMPFPKTSQLFEAVNSYIMKSAPDRVYAVTATPARNPMAVYALSCFLGRNWNFYEFRDAFYTKLPMPGREVFQPKKDSKSKARLARIVLDLSHGFIGRLDDFFEVPKQTYRTIECPLSSQQKLAIAGLPIIFPDPLVLLQKTAQIENGFLIDSEYTKIFTSSKFKEILKLYDKHQKVLVFCRYRNQINHLEMYLRNRGIKSLVLTGDTKDREGIFKAAEFSNHCVFIAQAQISSGYELPSFHCTVFMSSSYSSVDYQQSLGRTLRANALAEKTYVHLIAGDIDKAIKECLDGHQDFSELLYAKRN